MMKHNTKYILLASVLSLVAATACQRDELTDRTPVGEDILKFSVGFAGSGEIVLSKGATLASEDGTVSIPLSCTVTDGIEVNLPDAAVARKSASLTKGTQINSEAEFLGEGLASFTAAGWNADKTEFVPSATAVTYYGGKWKTDATYRWRGSDNKTFLACANLPSSAAVANSVNPAVKQTFSYTVPTDAREQNDIMLGWYEGDGDGTATAAITMVHPLTAVVFKKGEIDEDVIAIKSISISGVYTSGVADVTYALSGSDVAPTYDWGSSRAGSQTVTLGPAEGASELEVAADGKIGTSFIVLPQTVAEGTLTLTITVVKDGEESVLAAFVPAGTWEEGKTNTYTLNYDVIVYDKYYLSYHWNDGGRHSGDQEIFKSEEYPTRGSHDIILQEPNWAPKNIDDYYTFLGWSKNPNATEAEYIQPGRGETGLKTSINLKDEYTNLYAVWKKVEFADSWVDFENYEINAVGNFRIDHIDDWGFNRFIALSGTFTAGYEKIGFPIHNLTPGKWYYIKFSEALTPTTEPYNPGSGIYGCTMKASRDDIKPSNKSSMISYTTNADPKAYVWTHTKSDAIWGSSSQHEAMSDQVLTFYASAETMYWIWDLSKINDNVYRTYSFSYLEINMIEVPDAPTVNMLETSLHGFKTSAETDSEEAGDADNKGCSSFKVNADFTSLEMKTYGRGSYEKINTPLINLEPGTKYKLSFNYTISKLNYNEGFFSGNDFCFGVSESQNTQITIGNFNNTSSASPYYVYSPNIASKVEDCQDKYLEIEFTATASTMYWVWSVSNLADNTFYHHLFKNVTLAVVDE